MVVPHETAESKSRALRATLVDLGSALIAYSGGVDSSYLASTALDVLGPDRVLAVIGRSPSYPRVQREMAVRVAESLGLPYEEIETQELGSPDYVANAGHRCFHCKTELYGRLSRVARERGLGVVLDGSNADDRDDHRPGMAAARELGVRSPLQEVGLTKAEIRALARGSGLPNWEAPASPCLASRLAYGIEVTPERLRQVERAEARLRDVRSWEALRVRHHGQLGRLEVAPADLEAFSEVGVLEQAIDALRDAGFSSACLDLEGYRSGALNVLLRPNAARQGGGPSVVAAERALRDRGAAARVTAVAGTLVQLGPREAARRLIARRAEIVAACRGAGFHFVALSLY